MNMQGPIRNITEYVPGRPEAHWTQSCYAQHGSKDRTQRSQGSRAQPESITLRHHPRPHDGGQKTAVTNDYASRCSSRTSEPASSRATRDARLPPSAADRLPNCTKPPASSSPPTATPTTQDFRPRSNCCAPRRRCFGSTPRACARSGCSAATAISRRWSAEARPSSPRRAPSSPAR